MTVHGMHREASIEINASPEAVYDLVSDLPRMGEWSPENTGGEWQGGGRGQVGDRFTGQNRAGEFTWSALIFVWPDSGPASHPYWPPEGFMPPSPVPALLQYRAPLPQ